MWEQWPTGVTNTELLTPDVTAAALEYPYVDPVGVPVRYARCQYCHLKVEYDEAIIYGTTVHMCQRRGGKTAVLWKPFQAKESS